MTADSDGVFSTPDSYPRCSRGGGGHPPEVPRIDRHAELAHFLRAHRKRLAPPDAGVELNRRRRTLGLRREEVAELAGISTDWYTWLEQGRKINPSLKVLDSIARALQLKPDQRSYLLGLAQAPASPAASCEHVPAALQRIVQEYPQAAYVIGRSWNLLAWNRHACELLLDFDSSPPSERNLLRYLFLDQRMRDLLVDWHTQAQRILAQFRPNVARYPQDPGILELLATLRRRSREFSDWWENYDINCQVAGTKRLRHAHLGELSAEYLSLQPADAPDLRLIMYTPYAVVRHDTAADLSAHSSREPAAAGMHLRTAL